MKAFAYILSILVIGLTMKPLMHHYAHEHGIAHSSATLCNCCNVDNSSTHDYYDLHSNEADHDHHSDVASHEHENSTSNCSCEDDNNGSNCGEEGHQCDGHCNCAFSISSNFSIEKTEQITVAEFSIIRKYIFISEYHFDLPNIIWHPPKFLVG